MKAILRAMLCCSRNAKETESSEQKPNEHEQFSNDVSGSSDTQEKKAVQIESIPATGKETQSISTEGGKGCKDERRNIDIRAELSKKKRKVRKRRTKKEEKNPIFAVIPSDSGILHEPLPSDAKPKKSILKHRRSKSEIVR